MEPKDIVLIAVALLILAEVTVILARMPRTSLSRKNRSMLLDTSVLIDGRIVAIARSGFVTDTLVVPRSVLGELQFLADNADADKRARARYGLDIVAELQQLTNVTVEILQDGSKAEEGVDERLLKLAKQYGAALCTIDFNLNKVALVENITVLNINELSQQLRMSHLPGETMLLELVQKGQDQHQAVGYMPDGTMVVVERANALIGQTVEVEVIRSLQTAAGKMMFARRVEAKSKQPQAKKPTQPAKSAKPAKQAAKSQPKRTHHAVPQTAHAKPAVQKPETQDQPKRHNNRRRRQTNEDKLMATIERQS